MRRRDFVHKGLAASAALFTGCAARDRTPGNLRVPGMFCADVHCHIFNGEDLDAFGYLAQDGSPKSLGSEVLTPFRGLLRQIVRILKLVAPGRDNELALLDNLLDRRAERLKHGKQGVTRSSQLAILQRDIVELKKLSSQQARRYKMEMQRRCMKDSLVMELAAEVYKTLPEMATVANIDTSPWRQALHPYTAMELNWPQNWLGGLISSIMSHRVVNAIHLIERYPDVQLFVAASLDMDVWFHDSNHSNENNPSESVGTQAEMMGKISVLTEGRIIPRTGFCPLRQVKWDAGVPMVKSHMRGACTETSRSPLQTLSDACNQWGSIGAKLYPVLGFRIWDNEALANRDFDTIKKPWKGTPLCPDANNLGRQLDAALHRLYSLCDANHYSIMAHTNHSRGPSSAAEGRTAPWFFSYAAQKYPNVRWDLGHFGGLDSATVAYEASHGPPPSTDADAARWPEWIAQYGFGDPGIYADISFVSANARKALAPQNLAYFFKTWPISKHRVMYGSDWHELLSSPSSYGFYKAWRKCLDEPRFGGVAERIMGQNAADFLGIRKGQPARRRLDDFFHRWNVRPDWSESLNSRHEVA